MEVVFAMTRWRSAAGQRPRTPQMTTVTSDQAEVGGGLVEVGG
jgi:hypothetical protein